MNTSECSAGRVIVSVPMVSPENPYQKLFYDNLKPYGYSVSDSIDFKLRDILRNRRKIGIIHIHWPPVRNDLIREMISPAGLLVKLMAIKIIGLRLIWTAHNLVPHERRLYPIKYLKQWLIAHFSDLIIVHFEGARRAVGAKFHVNRKKVAVMHHGSYAGFYPDKNDRAEGRRRLGIPEKTTVFLYFGQIRPYKNLEMLVRAFKRLRPQDCLLLMAGKPVDLAYKRDILQLIGNDEKIRPRFEFIADEDVQHYFNSADCMILPYGRIFTSGAAMLALTFKKPVIMKKCDFSIEYLNAGNSILPEDCGEAGLARAMEKFIEKKGSYSVSDETVARYEWPRIVRELLNDPAAKKVFSGTDVDDVRKDRIGMRIAYILDVFPKISETFILNEILEVQRRGLGVSVFASTRLEEDAVHPQVEDVKSVRYWERPRIAEMVRDHAWFIFNHPLRYLRALIMTVDQKNESWKYFITRLGQIRDIKRSGAGLIHAHFALAAADIAMLAHVLTGIPFTFTSHAYDIFKSPPGNFKLKVALSKKHVTISMFNKRYITSKFACDERKIAVVHCGVDFLKDSPEPRQYDGNSIVSVARLEHAKGLDVLIKACSILKRQNVVFQCSIAGEGSERAELEKLIDDLDVKAEVKLLGSLTQHQVFKLLSGAKVAVLSSRAEGIPVSLMEAMSMKVPVIGPNIHGVFELIEDGKNGILVPPNHENALAKKIRLLIENDGLRGIFKEKGYEKVEKEFNLQREVGKLIAIWTDQKVSG